MTRKTVLALLLPFAFSACFLVKEYKRTRFTYNRNGQSITIPMVVPKGYVKMEKRDTVGVTLQTFYYPGGAMLYAAYLSDTTFALQPFDLSLHQPQVHRLGGLVYKGQDSNELYYREIQQGHLRFGYRQVPEAFELQFDSATNQASLQKNSLR